MNDFCEVRIDEFYDTYKLFKDYIGYTQPMTFDQWASLPYDWMPSALYVQFYNQIKMVWNQIKHPCVEPAEVVDTVLQYLEKNVPKILSDPKRFYAGYIYKITYNCVACLTVKPESKYRRRYDSIYFSTTIDGNDEELEVYYNIPDTVDLYDEMIKRELEDYISNFSEEEHKTLIYFLKGYKWQKEAQSEMIDKMRKRLFNYCEV